MLQGTCSGFILLHRVPTVREKSGKNVKNSRSWKSQGILKLVREIYKKKWQKSGKSQGISESEEEILK